MNYIFIITLLHILDTGSCRQIFSIIYFRSIVMLLSFYIFQYNVIALKCCPIKLCTSCKNRQMFVCRTLLFGSRHVCDLFFPKFSFVLAIRCLVFENTKDYVWNMHPFVKTLRLDDFLSVTANLCFLLLFHRCHWNTRYHCILEIVSYIYILRRKM